MDSNIEAFSTTFAVPLHCNACIQSVSSVLQPLPGVQTINADLSSQLVHITGTTPPSKLVDAIQSTGRDAVLRGSGQPNSAAVCIFETSIASQRSHDTVRGLARLVQVRHIDPPRTLVDLVLQGMKQGTYEATVRETGDISRGAESAGCVWGGVKSALDVTPNDARRPKGYLGLVQVAHDGRGSVFLNAEVAVTDLVGRGMVVSERRREGPSNNEPGDEVMGVVARSAGVWENDKTVCSCTGKTIWEERKEQLGKGVL